MSREFSSLLNSERRIRNCFFTKTLYKYPTSSTSQLKLKSYRLLVHAEIEYFFENVIISKITFEKNKWLSTKKITYCLSCILAFSNSELHQPPSRLSEISNKNDFEFRLTESISLLEKKIKKNNGIKEESILPYLISIGTDYLSIDQVLLNNLSSFGINRGDSAHQSIKVQTLINPVDEKDKVDHILIGLKKLDGLIQKI